MIPMICLTSLHVTLVLQRKLCQMSSVRCPRGSHSNDCEAGGLDVVDFLQRLYNIQRCAKYEIARC